MNTEMSWTVEIMVHNQSVAKGLFTASGSGWFSVFLRWFMEMEGKHRLIDVFVGLHDPRQAKKVGHDLMEMLVVAVCAVLAGTDDFVEIEELAEEKPNWFRQYLTLENGLPSIQTQERKVVGTGTE